MAATWIVVPALEAFRHELNEVAPDRDKTSDGSIGDQAHASGVSGHNPDETGRPEDYDADSINEVRARDFDKDLRRPGLTMEMVVQFLVRECQAGRITWIKYLIFAGRIWMASDGFKTHEYRGSNKHDEHAHLSCKPDTRSENTTRKVGLATLVKPVAKPDAAPVTPTKESDMQQSEKLVRETGYASRTVGHVLADLENLRNALVSPPGATLNGAPLVPEGSVLDLLTKAAVRVEALVARLNGPEITVDGPDVPSTGR